MEQVPGGGNTGTRAPAGGAEEPSVMRVNQLDAGVLDTELHGLLKKQLGRACSSLPAGTLERFKPEVDALFNLLMFRFTVWVHRPTPGMHLQGLRYRNEGGRSTSAAAGNAGNVTSGVFPSAASASGWEGGAAEEVWGEGGRGGAAAGGAGGGALGGEGAGTSTGSGATPTATTGLSVGAGSSPLEVPLPFWGDAAPTRTQRLMHGLLSVGVQWGFARLRRHALVHGWSEAEAGIGRRMAWQVLGRLETMFRVIWMVNLLLFLRSGLYATPVDRLLRMRMVHDRPDPGPRTINYQFLNRRLLWDHWAKMAYVVAPLINWNSIRRTVSGGAGRLRREARALGIFGSRRGVSSEGRGAAAARTGTEGAGAAAGPTSCAECGATPANTPYVTDCGHVFCYYCARLACTMNPRYACPLCGEYFATSRRWSRPG